MKLLTEKDFRDLALDMLFKAEKERKRIAIGRVISISGRILEKAMVNWLEVCENCENEEEFKKEQERIRLLFDEFIPYNDLVKELSVVKNKKFEVVVCVRVVGRSHNGYIVKLFDKYFLYETKFVLFEFAWLRVFPLVEKIYELDNGEVSLYLL